jgi:hypothetical protein
MTNFAQPDILGKKIYDTKKLILGDVIKVNKKSYTIEAIGVEAIVTNAGLQLITDRKSGIVAANDKNKTVYNIQLK